MILTGSLISTTANATSYPPVPARKPAAFRADPLALLRFPALNEAQPYEEMAAAPALTPETKEQPAKAEAPLIPARKPAYQPVETIETEERPAIIPETKPELVMASIPADETLIQKRADSLGLRKFYKKDERAVKAAAKAETKDREVVKPVATLQQPLESYNRLYKSPRKRPQAQRDSIARLINIVKQDISNDSPTRALKRLSNDKAVAYLDPVEKDQLQTLIARGYLLAGKIVQSYELASESANRSGAYIPQAGWIAGLAAWRMGNYEDAARMFANSANSSYGSAWQASGSAYWTARAYMRAGKPQEVATWLKQAAAYPRTFYGLIATRSLGWDYNFNWDSPRLTSEHKKAMEGNEKVLAAFELLKDGKFIEAQSILTKIDVSNDPLLREGLMALAISKNLTSLSMKLAQTYPHPEGGYYDAALFPLLPWKMSDGYRVDRALVHAIVRQESKFNPSAVSSQGAQGLMQVMPATASYISGMNHFKNKAHHASLQDPQTNLDLGQRYIEKLLYQDHVDEELFSLVIAYNAGPGNLKRWKRELADIQDDPLLFIESIPVGETRAYVERVMSNYWIYRLRMSQPIPSLDAVAEGQWAHYTPIDGVKQAGLPSLSSWRLATTQ